MSGQLLRVHISSRLVKLQTLSHTHLSRHISRVRVGMSSASPDSSSSKQPSRRRATARPASGARRSTPAIGSVTPLVFSPELLRPAVWKKVSRRARRLPVRALEPEVEGSKLPRKAQKLLRLTQSTIPVGSAPVDPGLEELLALRISSLDNPLWWKTRFARFLESCSKPALIAAVIRLTATS